MPEMPKNETNATKSENETKPQTSEKTKNKTVGNTTKPVIKRTRFPWFKIKNKMLETQANSTTPESNTNTTATIPKDSGPQTEQEDI